MSNLQNILASKFLAAKQIKNISSTDFIIDDVKNKVYFLINVHTGKISKDGESKTKLYKKDITSYIRKHGSLEMFFKVLITSEMLLEGYLLIPIEGGYLCVGGEEIYSLKNNECTCPAFLNDSKQPCKHLLFRDGLLNQRSRINDWKLAN